MWYRGQPGIPRGQPWRAAGVRGRGCSRASRRHTLSAGPLTLTNLARCKRKSAPTAGMRVCNPVSVTCWDDRKMTRKRPRRVPRSAAMDKKLMPGGIPVWCSGVRLGAAIKDPRRGLPPMARDGHRRRLKPCSMRSLQPVRIGSNVGCARLCVLLWALLAGDAFGGRATSAAVRRVASHVAPLPRFRRRVFPRSGRWVRLLRGRDLDPSPYKCGVGRAGLPHTCVAFPPRLCLLPANGTRRVSTFRGQRSTHSPIHVWCSALEFRETVCQPRFKLAPRAGAHAARRRCDAGGRTACTGRHRRPLGRSLDRLPALALIGA